MEENQKIHYTVLVDLYRWLANNSDLDAEAVAYQIQQTNEKILSALDDALADENGNFNIGDVIVGLVNLLASFCCTCTVKGKEDVMFFLICRVIDTFKKRCVEIGMAMDEPKAVIPLDIKKP